MIGVPHGRTLLCHLAMVATLFRCVLHSANTSTLDLEKRGLPTFCDRRVHRLRGIDHGRRRGPELPVDEQPRFHPFPGLEQTHVRE